jgi:hypothetical protein
VAPSSIYDRITRQHPAYKAGLALGTDIGTRMALDVIWAEWGRQVDAALVVDQPPAAQQDTRNHAYAAGRLAAVARIVGATFRQLTHE